MSTLKISDPVHRKLKILSAQRGARIFELADTLISEGMDRLAEPPPSKKKGGSKRS